MVGVAVGMGVGVMDGVMGVNNSAMVLQGEHDQLRAMVDKLAQQRRQPSRG